MFFSKSLIAISALCLSLSLQAHAHAAIAPALDVEGTPVRSDVQRPTKARPCGKVDLSGIDTSTAITPAANGSFVATITNFNPGLDGSRQVTAAVSADGTGQDFVDAEVLQNGEKRPTSTGSQQLVVQMPAGMTCTGGASQSKCLVSFVTAGRFGNCVVVDQGASASTNATTGTDAGIATDAAATSVADASTTDAAATSTSMATTSAADEADQAQAQTKADKLKQLIESQLKNKAVGTRAARIARRVSGLPVVEVLV
ncbi:hypothetical protein DICSQDRAFT_171019 [Dichomitus squalens LYAD-421 SS1]|uniref:Uncharacterized protein n=2 Tax=Dichomitus squalens TaxID=114155 RepID=A0A4Q9MU19_9APHY|nr:uncharacterized protein DICSQDRAFT_171019 [Dichomitus squalens LYAD-421 SS1]EJF60577.1 hypothetical protein DICSQDRAFT_171019 [Dichomitus squalens LYAD-421 SS1]TBU30102.1 hypothetical protein BD311DRAFT_719268 [Dichomitus squalens]